MYLRCDVIVDSLSAQRWRLAFVAFIIIIVSFYLLIIYLRYLAFILCFSLF